MIDVLTFGETMLSVRTSGPLRAGGSATTHIAGAESNVAIGLARLGHAARWVGVVGADVVGDAVLAGLRAEGVDVAHARRQENAATGTMLLESRTADLARVAYNRAGSAGSTLRFDDLQAALAEPARWWHVTGVTAALGAGPAGAVRRALARRAHGTCTSLDVNYRARLWDRDRARAELTPLLQHLDLVVASEDELDLLGEPGCPEEEGVARLFAAGVREVVVKRGPRGASLRGADGAAIDLPARPATVVDPVGAGDALVAGVLSGALDGLPPRERLQRGIDVAAYAVSTVGDWEGLPTRAELDQLPEPDGDPTLR